MKFGMMAQIQMPMPWAENAERQGYANLIEQVVAAEQAGFDYFWITEQHFFIEIGHCPCPDMVLAALSQRTSRIKLGFGVFLLPLHHPFYIAERVATLDVLSNGRAQFGVGRGTSPYMVDGLGFDPAEGREIGREALEAVMKMFEADWFPGYKGERFDLPARHVVPRPVQRPHPPLWVAATNFETYQHAGRQGMGVIGVTRFTPEETKPFIDGYRAAIQGADRSQFAGKYANEHVGAFAVACCLEDDRLGRDVACAAARWYYGDNEAVLNSQRFATGGGVSKVNERIASRSNDELIRDAMAIGGNPDTVSRQVEQWRRAGLDQMVLMLQAGKTAHQQVMRSIELIGRHVIPRFAEAEQAA